jgi:hypothetical protein
MNDMSMEQLVAELRKMIRFKPDIDTGDLVLIVADDPRLITYGVITDIEADTTRRDPWWHVHMQMLAVPLQEMTWTLRMEQMCGREIFTMGGKKRFMAPVLIEYGHSPTQLKKDGPGQPKKKPELRVIK